MNASASATTRTHAAAGRHAGRRHPQDWKGAGRPVAGRHAQLQSASDQQVPAAFARLFAVPARGC